MGYSPCYSLGGGTTPGGIPAVPGTAIGAGRPVSLLAVPQGTAIQNCPVMVVISTAASANVIIECNGGPVDINGNPPDSDWLDVSSGGYTVTAGSVLGKRCPPGVPFWRARLSAYTGPGSVTAYFPVTNDCPAAYPPSQAVTSEF
jgi:hypothetical protein